MRMTATGRPPPAKMMSRVLRFMSFLRGTCLVPICFVAQLAGQCPVEGQYRTTQTSTPIGTTSATFWLRIARRPMITGLKRLAPPGSCVGWFR